MRPSPPRSNIFNPWALFTAASLSYLALPLAWTQAAMGPRGIKPEAQKVLPASGVPTRSKITAIYGDPARPGPFAIRLRFPAGLDASVGVRPADGYVTVISGKVRIASSDAVEASMARPLVPGDYATLPAGAPRSLWGETESVVEVHSIGPSDVWLRP
jgi:hypothetical protein